MSTKTKAEHIKQIESIYYQIIRVTEGRHYVDNFIDELKKDEKQHRNWRPSSITKKYGLTINQSVQYWLCRWILKGKEEKPNPKDYLHLKKACFTGYALYHEYKEDFKAKKVFNKKNTEIINSFDYAEYI